MPTNPGMNGHQMNGGPDPAKPAAMPGGPESKTGMNRPAGSEAVSPMSGPAVGADNPEPEAPTTRSCGVMDVHRRLLSQSAAYRSNRDAIETAALEASRFGPRFSGVARIPVVVHIVYKTAAQNISDAQVQSQIAVLNRDYRATNPDVSTVPGVFQPLVGDPRIEFFLAQTDPAGNPTTGITRTTTTKTGFTTDDAVKSTATGGADPWPADRYLNMWAAPLTGGLLGYAQFPGGPAGTDGVVILTTAFGDTGNVVAPFHLGRTATHEVGHYLDLFHIWGDDGTGCSGSDQVSDTPNQGGPNVGAPAFPHVSCSNGPNGDLFMNYMDYVDDPAMVMFSNGQIARMQACLDGVRSSLVVGSALPVPAGPALSWGADRLDTFVLGTDRAIYHKWWNGSDWGPAITSYEYMGGTCMTEPEVASWGANRLDAFVIGTDSALYHKWFDGNAWGPSVTGYENLGGVCFSKPAVATWAENRLDVFVLGGDSAIYHKWFDGNAWGPSIDGFESLGGTCASEPVVVSWGENRLDLFVLGTDSAVYHKWFDGSSWGPSIDGWESMGGTCASAPTAVAWSENRLDLFVLGTDHAVYHKWFDGNGWGPAIDGWEYMGGSCTSAPTVVAWGPNRLDLFVTGTDSALYHKWWDGNAWGPSIDGYQYLGGVCVGRPRAAAWAADRLDVFVTGTDSALYHKWWDGSAWGPSDVGYEYLGGVISDFRLTDEDVAGVTLPAPAPQPVLALAESTKVSN